VTHEVGPRAATSLATIDARIMLSEQWAGRLDCCDARTVIDRPEQVAVCRYRIILEAGRVAHHEEMEALAEP